MTRRIAAFLTLGAAVVRLAAFPAAEIRTRICPSLEEAAPPGTGAVLLVFFSTDCRVCYDDLFEARHLAAKRGWPIAIVGVFPGRRDDLESFLEKYAWTAPVVLDRRRILFRRFAVDVVPYKVLLVGGEAVHRDDPYVGHDQRWAELTECLSAKFSR